jgi:hypothetical protein
MHGSCAHLDPPRTERERATKCWKATRRASLLLVTHQSALPQHVHGRLNITMANGVPIPENKIFKQRDPSDTDENNWATFDLRNVEIVNKKGQLVNLLHADSEHPVTVSGTLQALQKQNSHLCEFTQPHFSRALLIRRALGSITLCTHQTQECHNSSQKRGTFRLWSLREWRC